jgi:hypothetical protein
MKNLSMRRFMGPFAVLATLAVVVLLLWQPWNGGGADLSPEAPDLGGNPISTATPAAGELSGILATTDLGLGPNRVSFLVISPRALITVPQASVTSTYLPADGSPPVVKEEVTATFYLWPYGTRGSYATQLTFDRPGAWELEVSVQDVDGTAGTARISLKVRETSATPAIGSLPPMNANKTAADVTDLGQLTTWYAPDPELYQKTIPQAVNSQSPSMVVFASPALCTSPTCGPQVETVQEIKERYKDRANFIHVEVYDNPDEIQGNLGAARYSPVVEAWGLTGIEDYLNESWVFILDREGRIAFKYQGFASAEELELDLLQVLQPRPS